MRKVFLLLITIIYIFAIEFTKQEKEFLKNNPVIYISAMSYWPVDKNGKSLHIKYLNLLNKYGHLNLQPVYYQYWSDGFNDAKNGITDGIMAVSFSKKREKYFFFTKAYNYTPYYLIVNKNSKIHSIEDIKGKNIFIAQNSILREVFKNKDFNIINVQHPYKKLANNEIDGMFVFYIPKTKYINSFRIIKTFVDKSGEEHMGISKKYPELYSIIQKVIKVIPYSEIEKIRESVYEKRIIAQDLLTPEIKISDYIKIQDIILVLLVSIALMIIFYLFFSKKFLQLSLKKFLISIFVFDVLVLGFIVYEVLVYNYYSNKILQIKSKSFNALFLVDSIEYSIHNLQYNFLRKILKHRGDVKKLFYNRELKADNLLVNNKPLKEYLNTKYFTSQELVSLAYIRKLIDEIIYIYKDLLNKKVDISIYRQKFLYIYDEIFRVKNIIKSINNKEIAIIKNKLKYQFLLLVFSVVLFIVESILLFVLIKKKIYKPIAYLGNVIKESKKGHLVNKRVIYKDEIGELIDEFFSLYQELHHKIIELEKHKKDLEHKIEREVEKRVFQEQVLLKQAKLALMGEMIDAIAHQWKQPLNTISLSVQLLELELEENSNLDKKYLQDFIASLSFQIKYMLDTLNVFRSFFRDNKQKEIICMKDTISKVLVLLKDDLYQNNIDVEVNIGIDFCIKGIKNEFEHLLVAIITNAKDIFIERGIKQRKITINTRHDEDFYYLEIIDNAGGIPKSIIDNIFE